MLLWVQWFFFNADVMPACGGNTHNVYYLFYIKPQGFCLHLETYNKETLIGKTNGCAFNETITVITLVLLKTSGAQKLPFCSSTTGETLELYFSTTANNKGIHSELINEGD